MVHLTIENGQPVIAGDYQVNGVAGSGAPIQVDFIQPGLGKLSRVLATGNRVDRLDVPGFGQIDASLIAAGGNTVFLRAEDLGLQGTEFAKDIENNRELLNLLELIRCIAAVEMELSPSIEFARSHQPSTPKIALVSRSQAFV